MVQTCLQRVLEEEAEARLGGCTARRPRCASLPYDCRHSSTAILPQGEKPVNSIGPVPGNFRYTAFRVTDRAFALESWRNLGGRLQGYPLKPLPGSIPLNILVPISNYP